MKIKAIQLDLARQMETEKFIFEFIDFISKYGFNSLVLYLEGRIKTQTFSFPSEEESYTLKQVKRIVTYAKKRNIETIPVVSNLGHANMFLQYPELIQLAELREGKKGRFYSEKLVFCPSLKETYEFFESYFSEVSEVFSSEYFHIGSDEVWDIGYCSICRERIESGETENLLFLDYLLKTHAILTGKLGKRIIMWDDMFEIYEDILEKVPKDIIMCSWNYNDSITIPMSHFFNRRRINTFQKYDKLGLSYLFAPREFSSKNIQTFSKYAFQYSPMGALLTTWERSTTFLYENYPNIAFAGKLWNSENVQKIDMDEIFFDVIKDIFETNNREFIQTILNIASISRFPERSKPSDFLRGPLQSFEYERKALIESFINILMNSQIELSTALMKRIFENILISLKTEIIQHRLRKAIGDIYELINGISFSRKRAISEIKGCLEELVKISEEREKQWSEYRAQILPCKVDIHYSKIFDNISDWLKNIQANNALTGLLNVYFCLPDKFASQKVRISLQYKNENKYILIIEGVFKPVDNSAFYSFSFPIDGSKEPESIKIETYGYGGQGFSYVDIVNSTGHFIPSGIIQIQGVFLNPEYILDDDRKWTFAGIQNVYSQFKCRGLAEQVHIIELAFRNNNNK